MGVLERWRTRPRGCEPFACIHICNVHLHLQIALVHSLARSSVRRIYIAACVNAGEAMDAIYL